MRLGVTFDLISPPLHKNTATRLTLILQKLKKIPRNCALIKSNLIERRIRTPDTQHTAKKIEDEDANVT